MPTYNIINGYGSPRMTIQNRITLVNVAIIELDMCMIESGLTENYKEEFKRVILDKNARMIDHSFKGSRITFNLDYSSYCRGANLMNLDLIEGYNSNPTTYALYFMPRTQGSGGRVFEVRSSGDGFSQGIHTMGINAVGHKGVRASYITTYAVSKNFRNTSNPIAVYY